MTINNEFEIGQTVTHKLFKVTEEENLTGVVIMLKIAGESSVEYIVCWETNEITPHTSHELYSTEEYKTSKLF